MKDTLSGYTVHSSSPIDDRIVKNTKEDVLDIPLSQRYMGLEVFCKETWTKFVLIDGTKNENWQEISFMPAPEKADNLRYPRVKFVNNKPTFEYIDIEAAGSSVFNWEVADKAEMDLITSSDVSISDIDKLLLQKDENIVYILTSANPIAWKVFSSGSIKGTTYIHKQNIASPEWVVVHNKNSVDYIFQVFDGAGDVMQTSKTDIDSNKFGISLATSATGKAVVIFAS